MKDHPSKTAVAARSYEKGLDMLNGSLDLESRGRLPSLDGYPSSNGSLLKAHSTQPGDFTLPRQRKNFVNTRSLSTNGASQNRTSSRVKELGSLGKKTLQQIFCLSGL